MSVLSQSFFTLMRRHFMSFSFFTAWHILIVLKVLKSYFFTALTNVFAGLNAGMLCAGMIIVVSFEMLRAVF